MKTYTHRGQVMSPFEKWFIAQHGERPQGPGAQELHMRISVGHRAKLILEAQERWDARRESALYAWTARDWRPCPISAPNVPSETVEAKHES